MIFLHTVICFDEDKKYLFLFKQYLNLNHNYSERSELYLTLIGHNLPFNSYTEERAREIFSFFFKGNFRFSPAWPSTYSPLPKARQHHRSTARTTLGAPVAMLRKRFFFLNRQRCSLQTSLWTLGLAASLLTALQCLHFLKFVLNRKFCHFRNRRIKR